MNEPDVIFAVGGAGFGAAIIAAVLYFFTSDREPPGFRVAPSSASGWVGYYFRTLTLVCIFALVFGGERYIHPSVQTAGLYSAILLVISSVVFWHSDRTLCIVGFLVGLLTLALCPVLMPSYS